MDQTAERTDIQNQFVTANNNGNYNSFYVDVGPWGIARRALAAAQMYDRLSTIDSDAARCRASHYLEYLRVIADQVLDWRDDKQGYPPDAFRNRIMAAWGTYDPVLDGKWSDDLSMAGLLAYPMAAFAKRVAANPSAFSAGYQLDAIRFTTAVMQTYASFRPELHFTGTSPWAYHMSPSSYSNLTCADPATHGSCTNYQKDAGNAEGWNEEGVFMRTIAEASSAASSPLYRNSSDPYKNTAISYLAVEGPDVIAKWVQFFDDYLNYNYVSDMDSSYYGARILEYWSGDNASYYVWDKKSASVAGTQIENTPHAQVTIGALTLIYENKSNLDYLLATAGYAERVNLSPSILERFAVNFLRLLWNTDNTIGNTVDGDNDGSAGANWNEEVAGYITLSPIDPWVWIRAHDSLDASMGFGYTKYREDNFAALIRYQ